MHERCAIAPELEELNRGVRVLLFGRRRRTYKIYFLVSVEPEPVVKVLHVRHWARKPVVGDELEDMPDFSQ